MSNSNTTALAYQKEVTWNVNPGPVVLQRLRFTKESLEYGKITVASAEIRPDRQLPEKVLTGIEAKGSIDFELSVGSFDAFLAGSLFSAFADVDGVPTLTNGVTPSSFLFEKRITDDTHLAYHGMMVDQLTLNLASRQIITGTLALTGAKSTYSAQSINAAHAGAAENYAAASTGLILSASANVGLISIGGTSLSSVKSLALTVANNLRGNDVIGKPEIDEVGFGSVMVSGKVEAYFRTPALLQAFMNHTYVALVVEMTRPASGAVEGDVIGYRITIPAVEFDKGNVEIGGKDQDIMLPLDFTAKADDAGTGKTIIIEKMLQA